MSLTGFHVLRDKLMSQYLQVVAEQGWHLGSSPYEGTAYRGVICGLVRIWRMSDLEVAVAGKDRASNAF
jgi:hypothetical protein